MFARGEAHVRRLAMLYAVLDGARSIGVPHLQAALAAWEYCERSARYVFGDDLDGTTADRILGALHCMEGPLSQTDLHNLFHRNISGTRLLTRWRTCSGAASSVASACHRPEGDRRRFGKRHGERGFLRRPAVGVLSLFRSFRSRARLHENIKLNKSIISVC
jgi:hypothetical protein